MKLSDLILLVGGCAVACYVFGPIVGYAAHSAGGLIGW